MPPFDRALRRLTNGTMEYQGSLIEEGLEEIYAQGERFNPEYHEAVSVEETDAERDGRVVDVWQKGYRLDGRLLRPSRVKVGRYAKLQDDG